jgi:tRNA (guanine-N7-)-methyltransferase
MNEKFTKWRFYGRRAGRKLNGTRQGALDEFLPKLQIPPDALTEAGDLAVNDLFKQPQSKTILEIGFGSGERLAEMIRRHPTYDYIAAEPFSNGMSAFLLEVSAFEQTDNLRVLMDDAIPLVKSLTPDSIDEIYVLNPDPWHKKRHFHRRIINPDNLDLLSRILKPQGRLILSTDVSDLAEWMITHTARHKDFEWTATCADDWRKPPKDWIQTRYETKGAKNSSQMNYMIFDRV